MTTAGNVEDDGPEFDPRQILLITLYCILMMDIYLGCMCVPALPLLVATLMVIIDSVQGVQVLLVLMVHLTQLHLAQCLMLLVWPTCELHSVVSECVR